MDKCFSLELQGVLPVSLLTGVLLLLLLLLFFWRKRTLNVRKIKSSGPNQKQRGDQMYRCIGQTNLSS